MHVVRPLRLKPDAFAPKMCRNICVTIISQIHTPTVLHNHQIIALVWLSMSMGPLLFNMVPIHFAIGP